MSQTPSTLNLPFAEVEANELKAAVVAKFGSLAQFCRITGRNLQKANDALRYSSAASKAYLEALFADAKKYCNQPAKNYHLTEFQRKNIRAALGRSTVVEFCQANPSFTPVYVSRITGGRTKKITKMVKELADALKVDLDEQETAN